VTLSRLLRLCGVGHMLMVGQDYAWINGQSHANGHHKARTDTSQRGSWHQETQNMDGETILTTVQYMTAKRELEYDLKEADFPIYNLYGGGDPRHHGRHHGRSLHKRHSGFRPRQR